MTTISSRTGFLPNKLKSCIILILFSYFGPLVGSTAANPPKTHWVATWMTALAPAPLVGSDSRSPKLELSNQTLRQIVHVSIGGNMLRVRLGNPFGAEPVTIGAAHIAIRRQGSVIERGSDRVLLFSGRPSIVIPPNGTIVSDAVPLETPASGDLAITLFFPVQTHVSSLHGQGPQQIYLAQGDGSISSDLEGSSLIRSWAFLEGVDVLASSKTSAVVAFGDSITDGVGSTLDQNNRWPDVFARRLLEAGFPKIAVLNAGIGGNRILHDGSTANVPTFGPNAISRFARDVLVEPGVKFVIVMIGINDIGFPGTLSSDSEAVSAEDLIVGLRQLIEAAHERDLKIIGATLTPFARDISTASSEPQRNARMLKYYSPEKELIRQSINEWIRTSGPFDGVIDFDRTLRDATRPDRLAVQYDSGDHLHPNDLGYEEMGKTINLALFRQEGSKSNVQAGGKHP